MTIMQITGSSAIAAISFNEGNVDVQYTSNDKPYTYVAKNPSKFESDLQGVLDSKESIGRFVANSRKSGELNLLTA
tara:strand:+ start:176 stop:403 length:228 start_codon:yes stop_codon:yes gene_type:complete